MKKELGYLLQCYIFHISNTVNTDRRKGYQIKLVKVNRTKTQI